MIEIEHIYKNFDEKKVLVDVNAIIQDNEIFTIIGPSGQGKSTLLRLINLLDVPTSGHIVIDGVDIYSEKGKRMDIRRKMSMVFQKPVVFNTTVYENIAVGLKYRGYDSATIKSRINEALEVIGLAEYGQRKAKTLSGGEMQRVALARSMVTEPDILLLDEPTANLDPIATENIEELIKHYNSEYNTTVVMSTHDMQQGQRLAKRIGVMMNGNFSQTGSPREVFSSPQSMDVARFVGIENIFEGTILSSERDLATINVGGISIRTITRLSPGTSVYGCIRPEDITIHLSQAKKISALNVLEGPIKRIIGVGPVNEVVIDCGFDLTSVVSWKSTEELGLKEGDIVRFSFKASAVHLIQDLGSFPLH